MDRITLSTLTKRAPYVAPRIDLDEFAAERGFAGSVVYDEDGIENPEIDAFEQL